MIVFSIVLPLLLISCCILVYMYSEFNKWIRSGHLKIESLSHGESTLRPESLPPLLQKYLQQVLVRKPSSQYVRFTQLGDFRMKPQDKMSKFSAEQLVSVISPMFSWVANMRMGGLPVTVCDRLIAGQGELQARMFASVPLARGSGESFLRGELLRYLAELPWYPMAILGQPDIAWVQTGKNKATGTLSMKSVSATVEYTFNDEGLICSIFVPDREMSVGKSVELKPWLGEFSQFEERKGVLIPIQGKVSWLLDSGKFTYFVGRITTYEIGENI